MEYLNFNNPLPVLSFDENSLFVVDNNDSNIDDSLRLATNGLLAPEISPTFDYQDNELISNLIVVENLDDVFPVDDPNNPHIALIPPDLIVTELGDINQQVATETIQKVDAAVQVSDLSIENIFSEICDCCNKVFNNKKALTDHVTSDKPYDCKICEKRFSQLSNLWKHVRTHTGEKPFKCCECDKTFTQRGNMLKHYRIHSGEKSFKCNMCEKTFAQEANLNKHLLLHNQEKPFQCDQCDKRFAQKSNLNKHQLVHSGIKAFGCNVCGQFFTQRSNLNKHLSTHESKVDLFCEFCKKPYIQKDSFQRHVTSCKVRRLLEQVSLKNI